MKKFIATTLSIGVLSAGALLADTIVAKKVSASLDNIKCDSPVWEKAKAAEVILYPQTTIILNDKKANELNKDDKAKRAKVKALYNGKRIAFLIEWADGTKSVQKGYSSTSYADGFAVQFTNITDPNKLPYIGMGNEGREVVIHLQKAVDKFYEPNGNKDVSMQVNVHNTNNFAKDVEKFEKKVDSLANRDYEKVFVSQGFRSMTEIKGEKLKAKAGMKYKDGKWKGMVARATNDEYLDLNKPAIAVAFAVWDGDKLNRDGLKFLSSWEPVVLSKEGENFAKAVLQKVQGDVKNGEKIAKENCAACHNYGKEQNAPKFMAPNLSNIGGYSTAAYLRESIVDPSAVVVPGYNRNAHKNFEWYTVDDKGHRQSTMPPFSHLDKKSQDDLIAFLQTLKAEVEK
ncbi:MAG: c-type cytochrome [Epsilonproteobacteria bacterium]|nr:c-type cytochrome [Campylobacterota bacterium]